MVWSVLKGNERKYSGAYLPGNAQNHFDFDFHFRSVGRESESKEKSETLSFVENNGREKAIKSYRKMLYARNSTSINRCIEYTILRFLFCCLSGDLVISIK